MTDILHTLENTIKDRLSMDPALSYVAKLSAAGRAKIAQKVGEEAVETVIAAMTGNAADVTC
ncbi:MAG: phosphoribosyl-ATP diphosphatase, partial [Chakrabartia sp.]